MKKYLVFVVALFLAVSHIACNSGSDEISLESDIAIDESSTVIEEFVLSEDVEKINEYLTIDIDRTMKATNVFRGRHYTISRPTDSSYVDNGGWKLTDGHEMDVFDKQLYLGWKSGSPVTITFDLESNDNAIANITVACLRLMDYGIGLPESVSIEVSNDGEEYTTLGKIDTPKRVVDTEKYVYNFALPKATNARYIRINCSKQDHAFLFIDEICAYEYNENGTFDMSMDADVLEAYSVVDFYNYELNFGESEVKVSPSDADYNKEQNLAQLDGVDFQIYHFDAFPNNHSNSPKEALSLLTDGELHGRYDTHYFISQRGGGRHIVADLGNIMSVNGALFTFFDKHTWGVSTPPVYYVSVSENGTDWVTVYAYQNFDFATVERESDTHEIEFDKSYRARYVRLTFETVPDNEITSSVYLGEFGVIGKKNPEGAVTAEYNPDIKLGNYVSREEYGINNILFVPITDGYGKHCTTEHVMNEETAYISLATFDESGKANGVFMDTMAFSTRGELNDYPDRSEGLGFFFDELFYDGLNLDAVEAMKEKLNSELGTNDKVKILINVTAPKIGDTFEGKEVKNTDDMIRCLKWQTDEIIRRFDAKEYKNLEFIGFYWQHEVIRDYETDPVIIKAFNEYVHQLDYISFWCPYFHARGFYLNSFLGFDITCLQPNYMFNHTEPTRLSTVAEYAKIYGMCVEIEIESGTKGEDAVRLYRDYLKAGFDMGYMNSIKVFYQGATPGAFVQGYKSDDEYQKQIYLDSLLYAADKIDENFHVVSGSSIDSFTDAEITVKHGESSSISIGSVDETQYRYFTTPTYGSVKLDADGTLTYTAMKGYKGEDIIKIELFDGISNSKIITIKVTVTE